MNDDLIIDETVDTKSMAPEDDFASPSDPRIPRKGANATSGDGATTGDSYYGAAPRHRSTDLSQSQWDRMDQGSRGLPNAFDSSEPHEVYRQPKEVEFVGDPDDVSLFQQPRQQPAVPQPENDPTDPMEFDPALLNAAGLTAEQAAMYYQTPDQLQQQIRMMDMNFVQQGMHALNSQVSQQPQQDIVPTHLQPPAPSEATRPGEDEFQLPENENGWEDDTKRLVEAVVQHNNKQLAKRDQIILQQQQMIEQQIEAQRREAGARELAEFDHLVNALPDEWTPYLGRGNAHELPIQSIPFQNRMQLEKTMMALNHALVDSGRPPLPKDELMVRALSVAFPQQTQQVVHQQVTQQVDQRRQMMTAPPTHRQQPVQNPTQAAIASAQEWYSKHNLGSGDQF